jgi:hypothetical protein
LETWKQVRDNIDACIVEVGIGNWEICYSASSRGNFGKLIIDSTGI